MKSAEIRNAFLQFFAEQEHEIVASSSLVPGNDPTLLFTNAGMVQFKDAFLGTDKRPYVRATSSQRCVRAGGKHNDLENVGYTARHHTFFEMLGNFSFGDYFKRDAIRFAWTFLTETLELPAEKLWITVHISDDEAEKIWKDEIGIDPSRFSKLDEDNFWQMGDTGPCGPSSEIFYDHGEDIAGGPPGSKDDDLDRYIEIWNLVFMQYERSADGKLTPLPKPSVDTGMGLERIAAVKQGVHNNYDIDLFQNLLTAVTEVTGNADAENMSRRVIADHIRSCAFLIVDGVLPSNEGRGYVLRRIIRRAVRHGHNLGKKDAFFYKLVSALCKEMGEAYPELIAKQQQIETALLNEEEQFSRTLDKGLIVLEENLADVSGDIIPGEIIFLLYDTYGFPVDLTNDIAREKKLSLDMKGYEACMEEQRKRARAAGKFSKDYTDTINIDSHTEFTGYETLHDQANIIALFKDGNEIDSLSQGDTGIIVTDTTPFYAESGGQAGDSGLLKSSTAEFLVSDTQKTGISFLHTGKVISGMLKVSDSLNAEVNAEQRKATALNHSATHLLHAALRQELGEHVQQKGSLVNADRLRFDFSHSQALSNEQLQKIETLVNQQIHSNSEVRTTTTNMEEAKAMGAMALFGEKYSDDVRVLSMGDNINDHHFSVELCGGTHVKRTGDIGLIHIISETGISSGVRRIEALTGSTALSSLKQNQQDLNQIAGHLKTQPSAALDKVQQLQQQQKQLEKEIKQLKSKLANSSGTDLSSNAVEINGTKVLIAQLEGADANALRETMDQLKNKLGSAVIFLAAAEGDKVSLVAGVTKDNTSKIKAGDIMKELAPLVGGKGGGRPDMAQGGGTQPENIAQALTHAKEWLATQLS